MNDDRWIVATIVPGVRVGYEAVRVPLLAHGRAADVRVHRWRKRRDRRALRRHP